MTPAVLGQIGGHHRIPCDGVLSGLGEYEEDLGLDNVLRDLPEDK